MSLVKVTGLVSKLAEKQNPGAVRKKLIRIAPCNLAWVMTSPLRRLALRAQFGVRLVSGKPLFVVVFSNVGNVHPRMAHFVDRPVAVADPLVWIGVVRIGRGVVVPGGYPDDGALRKHGRGVVRVDV